MPRPSRPRRTALRAATVVAVSALGTALTVAVGTAGCGASINAVYEGDVRFEHCMALDSRPDVKPTLRRACWQEWMKFYTFGQTRDRVEYALHRRNQLSNASDFDEGDWVPPSKRMALAPAPTSAAAPPPALIVATADAGAVGALDASAAHDGDSAAESSECVSECDEGLGRCHDDCKTAACEKACVAIHKRCMRKCL